MKIFFIFSLILLTFSTFASEHTLLLDASCKVSCVVGVTEVPSDDQGNGTVEIDYRNFYIDLFGLSREQIENKKEKDLVQMCRAKFGEKANLEKADCLFFKH